MSHPPYPFTAIVGQEPMKLALVLCALSPALSGVLIRGDKGTAKSTAVRGLAALLPQLQEVAGNPYHLTTAEFAEYGPGLGLEGATDMVTRRVAVVELPVGATEDRVAGTLDLGAALTEGRRRHQPGLLAAAHRGFLYVDEVNLLDDHVVDMLLDSAAMGVCTVEREGLSITHPARFSLVGTMNPEEGDLRPQLLDRFGLAVEVTSEDSPEARAEIIRRRLAHEGDPEGFAAAWAACEAELAARIEAAMALLPQVVVADDVFLDVAHRCLAADVDGHRGDITMVRAARALAAWEGRTSIEPKDVDRAGTFVLPHRLRRRPWDDLGAG